MAKQYQFRRGTDVDHLTFTGAEGELSVELTNDEVRLHDGTTLGGIPLLRADFSNLTQGSFTIDKLGPGDPNTFIIFDNIGVSSFQPTLDGSFIIDDPVPTVPTNRLVPGTPNTFATTDNNAEFVFKEQLSGELDFADESVTTNKLIDGAVTGIKIADWTILSDSLDEDSVTFEKLKNNVFTTDKIADNAILLGSIKPFSITNDKIQDLTITSTNISSGNITGEKIQNNAVFAVNFDAETAGNSLGARFTSETPPPSNDFGNNGDMFYILGDPVPQIFNVSFLKEAYNEGENGAINVAATSGGFTGLIVPYTITGITSDDISIPLTGNFVLDSNLQDSIPFSITNDLSTGEGNEIMVLTVPGASAPATATIIDTSTDAFSSTIIISTNTQNFDARTAIINEGWDGVKRIDITIIVNDDVAVGSNATTGTAFIIDNIPAGSSIVVTNNGIIAGTGGAGGRGGHQGGGNPGKNGGDAIRVSNTNGSVIQFINNGIIGGGAGGGGGGTGGDTCGFSCSYFGGNGGGGAGVSGGAGAAAFGANGPFNGNCQVPAAADGTQLVGGSGTSGCSRAGGTGGQGGKGGNLGLVGSSGTTGTPSGFSSTGSPGVGGQPGKAVVGIENISGTIGGDIRGAQI